MQKGRARRRASNRRKVSRGAGGSESGGLLTLSEVSRRTKISMPTLQKYKKQFASRIPSVGQGRRQRYPVGALEVFTQLREEGLSRRGRRRKGSSGPSQVAASRRGAQTAGQGLLSLQQIRKETGISYPTLLRYTKLHLDRIPHVGSGKRRRYPREAVEVFRELRRGSTRGRKPSQPGLLGGGAGGGDLAARIGRLEGSQRSLERQIRELAQMLKRPVVVTMRRG
jgi:hypothetical protein